MVGDVEVTFQLVLSVIAAIGVMIEVLTLLGPIAGDPQRKRQPWQREGRRR